MRDDRERLLDILEAIERIEKYTSKGREVFEDDELIQTWVVHHLEIIGEATRALSSEIKQNSPKTPWSQIAGMRNILVHHYFGVDSSAVWNAVDRDLPTLKYQVEAMLAGLSGESNRH
jgi:uncharacterized protein with HEPN domain